MQVENIGTEKIPSILKNPFSKNCVKRIHVAFGERAFASLRDGSSWEASGSVEFSNGNTKGEQRFHGETFDEVVAKIKAFINELQSQ